MEFSLLHRLLQWVSDASVEALAKRNYRAMLQPCEDASSGDLVQMKLLRCKDFSPRESLITI